MCYTVYPPTYPTRPFTAGYLSFGPMAPPGLPRACHYGKLVCRALQAVFSAHVAFASCARLRQSFLGTLRSQKIIVLFSMGPNLRYPAGTNILCRSCLWCWCSIIAARRKAALRARRASLSALPEVEHLHDIAADGGSPGRAAERRKLCPCCEPSCKLGARCVT